jgi:hypothetical protein
MPFSPAGVHNHGAGKRPGSNMLNSSMFVPGFFAAHRTQQERHSVDFRFLPIGWFWRIIAMNPHIGLIKTLVPRP